MLPSRVKRKRLAQPTIDQDVRGVQNLVHLRPNLLDKELIDSESNNLILIEIIFYRSSSRVEKSRGSHDFDSSEIPIDMNKKGIFSFFWSFSFLFEVFSSAFVLSKEPASLSESDHDTTAQTHSPSRAQVHLDD